MPRHDVTRGSARAGSLGGTRRSRIRPVAAWPGQSSYARRELLLAQRCTSARRGPSPAPHPAHSSHSVSDGPAISRLRARGTGRGSDEPVRPRRLRAHVARDEPRRSMRLRARKSGTSNCGRYGSGPDPGDGTSQGGRGGHGPARAGLAFVTDTAPGPGDGTSAALVECMFRLLWVGH